MSFALMSDGVAAQKLGLLKGIEKDIDIAKKIDRAVFPGLQGGPHMNNIAAMAVAFAEADAPEFKKYAEQVVKNAKVLAETLKSEGLKVFGTENHLMVVDCGFERGKEVAIKLEEAGIIVTLMMLSHFSFVTYEKEHHEDCERISAYFHQLRDFIFTLSLESQTKILNAID